MFGATAFGVSSGMLGASEVWPLLLTCCGGCACWSRVAKLDCVVFVGADGLVAGLVAGNYS